MFYKLTLGYFLFETFDVRIVREWKLYSQGRVCRGMRNEAVAACFVVTLYIPVGLIRFEACNSSGIRKP